MPRVWIVPTSVDSSAESSTSRCSPSQNWPGPLEFLSAIWWMASSQRGRLPLRRRHSTTWRDRSGWRGQPLLRRRLGLGVESPQYGPPVVRPARSRPARNHRLHRTQSALTTAMDEDLRRIECNRCGIVTLHDRLTSTTLWGVTDPITGDEIPGVGEPADSEYDWQTGADWCETYALLKCRGCNEVCLQVQRFDRAHPDDDPVTRYYPPRLFRRQPRWFAALPPELQALLDEVYAALAANSSRLAAMGLRAAIDMVLSDKVGDEDKNFFKKLERLEELGLVGKANREHLAAALDVGHAAAHRGYAPSLSDLERVLDIVENLLVSAYRLKDAAANIRKNTPRRFPRGVS